MLAVSMFSFHSDKQLYFIPFLCCIGLYLFVLVLSIIVEFGIRHTPFSGKNLILLLLRNLMEDIIAPLMYLKGLIDDACFHFELTNYKVHCK